MEYRSIGQSGLKVSAISIGGWLTFGKSVGQDTSHEILRAAIDRGVNFIDVADIYARGESERVVGSLIRDYQRQDLVISSKVYQNGAQCSAHSAKRLGGGVARLELAQEGASCPSMYCLMTERGAPPHVTTQYERLQKTRLE